MTPNVKTPCETPISQGACEATAGDAGIVQGADAVRAPDRLSILRHSSLKLTKTWLRDGSIKGYDDPKNFKLETVEVRDIFELSALLSRIESDTRACLIRGKYVGEDVAKERTPKNDFQRGSVLRRKIQFDDQPLHTLLIEIDDFEPLTAEPVTEPVPAIEEYISASLPEGFQGISFHWQLSSSAGHPTKAGLLKAHVWFWLATARTSAELKAWATATGLQADRSVLDPIQIHYTSAPVMDEGVTDPVSVRSGFVSGLCGDAVDLEIASSVLEAAGNSARKLRDTRQNGKVRDDLADFLFARWEVRGETADGFGIHVRCPWEAEHTVDTGPSSTTYFRKGTAGYEQGHFACRHMHCRDVHTDRDFEHAVGYLDSDFVAITGDEPVTESPLHQFYAYLPDHKYIHRATGKLYPAASVDGNLEGIKIDGKKPSAWLDKHRAVHEMTWWPGREEVIEHMIPADGAWTASPGQRVYNTYRAPAILGGEARSAERWREHLRFIYPDEADHIECWLAQRVQRPEVKLNHALVLGGAPGIGKDTLLEPVKRAVGAWNWQDIDPVQILAAFNPWVRAVVLRVNETRDLGSMNRFAFYEHTKTLIAAPPDMLLCNPKHVPQHYVVNVMGVIYTTNNKTDGIYLPANDRRHFVAWSGRTQDDFAEDYWSQMWSWFESGGAAHVAAFLRGHDLSRFDPKAPPPKTEAFFAIVAANNDPRDSEVAGVIDELGRPDALTIAEIVEHAGSAQGLEGSTLIAELTDRKNRRSVPHLMERAGYVQVRNPDAQSGLWRIAGNRCAAYGRSELSPAQQVAAVRELARNSTDAGA